MGTTRWFGIAGLLAVLTLALAMVLVALSGGWGTVLCLRPPGFCPAAPSAEFAANSYVAGIIGIALSAIGTGALLGTILYTARATHAAVLAAEAAKLAIDLARESSSRELRPYIAADGFNAVHVLGADGAVEWRRIDVKWQNVGATPARNVRARANSVVAGPLPPDFTFPDRDAGDAVGTLGRDKCFTSPAANHGVDEIAAVLRGEVSLHVWAWVEYDGFEPGTRYRSEYYCRAFFWGSDDPRDPALKANNLLGERFNGIDGNCMRRPQTPFGSATGG